MDGDACSCIHARTTMASPNGIVGAAAADVAALSEISDSVRNPDKQSLRSTTGQSLSCFSVVSPSTPITIKLQIIPGRVNKLGMMSKMWFPALEKSSSSLSSPRHLWTEFKL